jgi:two-component system LytT family response regulator
MLRAIIIDDMESARRSLAEDLASCCPEVTLIGEASSVATGLALIGRLAPDLLFLDIQLEDGTGFDLLRAIGRYDFRVIFTTASDAFGIQAIRFSALDYLLKPIDPDDLVAAVAKLPSQESPAGGSHEKIGVLLESLKTPSGGNGRIALNTADRVHVVKVAEIIRCESQRNYTLFHLTGKRQILVTRTLKEYDELLERKGFFRSHHSHLVNLACIREYVKGDGGYIVMTDNSEVPVAVRRRDALLRALL